MAGDVGQKLGAKNPLYQKSPAKTIPLPQWIYITRLLFFHELFTLSSLLSLPI